MENQVLIKNMRNSTSQMQNGGTFVRGFEDDAITAVSGQFGEGI